MKIIQLAILILSTILIMSCVKMKSSEDAGFKYLALGDSYTIGQGVDKIERWPIQLGEKLKALNYEIEPIKIIAQTGWTTSDLLQAIENTPKETYNLVSLSIGVNNQFQNKPFSLFKKEFNLLIDKSIELASNANRVFVVSIPDYGVTPFGSSDSENIAQELNKYNDYISKQCEERNITFINITEISRALGDSENALASDNLHPSAFQYSQWLNEILPKVIGLL